MNRSHVQVGPPSVRVQPLPPPPPRPPPPPPLWLSPNRPSIQDKLIYASTPNLISPKMDPGPLVILPGVNQPAPIKPASVTTWPGLIAPISIQNGLHCGISHPEIGVRMRSGVLATCAEARDVWNGARGLKANMAAQARCWLVRVCWGRLNTYLVWPLWMAGWLRTGA